MNFIKISLELITMQQVSMQPETCRMVVGPKLSFSLQLRTVLFNSMELLGSNHMELITKVCPKIEWLSLDSALTYNLEGLGRFNNLRFLKLNYRGRSIDGSVMNFFNANSSSLQHLHLIDIRDLTKADLLRTVGRCYSLETLVLEECSLAFNKARLAGKLPSSTAVTMMQLSI